jgi:hypothetical protein
MTAYFVVRAQILDAAVKLDFDRWYQDEHLPDAVKAFKAKRALRAWSQLDALVHYACYEFADAATACAILDSDQLKRLAAEFDRRWGDRVKRSRDVVEAIAMIGPSD